MPISDNLKNLIGEPVQLAELDKKYRLPAGGVEKLVQLEEEYNLPKGLLVSVSSQESGGEKDRSKALSNKGAMGWFQFRPDTAKAYGVDPQDFNSSAEGAAKMYADLHKQYGGDVDKMLAAYNWGSGNIARKGIENAPLETKNYMSKVKERINTFVTNHTPNKSNSKEQPVQKQGVGFPLNLLSPDFKKLLGMEEAKVETPNLSNS